MEEVKSPSNGVLEKISEIIREMGIEFFMNEKSLLIIDSYESKGKLYKTVVNAVEHLTTEPLLKKSIMESFKRNTFFSSDSDILNLFIGKDLKKGNTSLLNKLLENCRSDKENTNNNMKKIKFDKVIMNPPYDIGGKIWDEIRKVSENIVCLMPLAQYKANERYKYINYFEVVNNTLFDAVITDNLCITVSTLIKNDKTYEDFLLKSFNQNYKIFYEENGKRYRGLEPKVGFKVKYSSLNIDLDFVESHRSCSSHAGNGFGSNSAGYKWNHYKVDTSLSKVSSLPKDSFSGCFTIRFKNKVEKSNFSTWWYSNKKGKGLASKTLMGTNLDNVVGTCKYAIPQIDWEKISDHPLWKGGKYDEAVLATMGLRWEGERIVEI